MIPWPVSRSITLGTTHPSLPPRPSFPKSPSPQEYTLPLWVKHKVWASRLPHETWATWSPSRNFTCRKIKRETNQKGRTPNSYTAALLSESWRISMGYWASADVKAVRRRATVLKMFSYTSVTKQVCEALNFLYSHKIIKTRFTK